MSGETWVSRATLCWTWREESKCHDGKGSRFWLWKRLWNLLPPQLQRCPAPRKWSGWASFQIFKKIVVYFFNYGFLLIHELVRFQFQYLTYVQFSYFHVLSVIIKKLEWYGISQHWQWQWNILGWLGIWFTHSFHQFVISRSFSCMANVISCQQRWRVPQC